MAGDKVDDYVSFIVQFYECIYKYSLLYAGRVEDEFPHYKRDTLYIHEYLYNKIFLYHDQ